MKKTNSVFNCLIFIITSIFLIVNTTPVSAAHYVVGIVNNAIDGANSNERNIVLWNPANGINDNLTDIIGQNGNSGIDNIYMIDCELLNTPCNIGDTINLKVLNNGDNRISFISSLIITGSGYDIAPELTLNSYPVSNLISPVNNANLSGIDTVFNCSGIDPDSNLNSISLYGNWSGGWHLNETETIPGGSSNAIFTKQIAEGRYLWNCLSTDNLSLSNFSVSNYSFTVDRTPPIISSIYINQTFICGVNSYVRVNCSAIDNLLDVNNVIIQAIKPNGIINYTAQKTSNIYYADIPINLVGVWRFNCIANDSVGNIANLTSANFSVYDDYPDLFISSNKINFSDYNPAENEEVLINANISNLGCGDANNFLVGFFNGDPDFGGTQIGINKTLTIPKFSNLNVNLSWIPNIGTNNIFIKADLNNAINDINSTNNKANRTITLGSWQEFYGDVSIYKLLSNSDFSNMSVWNNVPNITGNIFISNKEYSINWNNLQALGKTSSGGDSTNDFSNADILLGMTNYPDSIYNTYTTNGVIDKTNNFTVFNRIIPNVPIVNSTNNTHFITGVLWDISADTNGYFDQTDKEPLVFVTKVNLQKQGEYGVYDYEFKIPALLRNYNSTSNQVYMYYELF